jgi:hypothetical protein
MLLGSQLYTFEIIVIVLVVEIVQLQERQSTIFIILWTGEIGDFYAIGLPHNT